MFVTRLSFVSIRNTNRKVDIPDDWQINLKFTKLFFQQHATACSDGNYIALKMGHSETLLTRPIAKNLNNIVICCSSL